MKENTSTHGALALLASGLLATCGSGDGDGPTDHGTYATYNTGLARAYVDLAEERSPHMGSAVAGIEADVICLQELWDTGDLEDVIAAAAPTHPHSHRVDTTDTGLVGDPACTTEDEDMLLPCVEEHCASVDPEQLSDCVLESCAIEFASISASCITCLVANLGGTIDDIFETCRTGSALYLYDAANGVLLLSRWPLEDEDHLLLDSTFNRRLVLFARVTNDAGERVAVACTHTTPNWDDTDIPYTGEHGSWTGEQIHQVESILEFLDEKTGAGEPVVLMGDMNDGPGSPPDWEEAVPEAWALFGDAGFVDPFATGESASCTYCESNTLNVDGTRNELIDHVLIRGFPEDIELESSRILDEMVTVETSDGPVDTHLSDHFGVLCRTSS